MHKFSPTVNNFPYKLPIVSNLGKLCPKVLFSLLKVKHCSVWVFPNTFDEGIFYHFMENYIDDFF